MSMLICFVEGSLIGRTEYVIDRILFLEFIRLTPKFFSSSWPKFRNLEEKNVQMCLLVACSFFEKKCLSPKTLKKF